MHNEHLVFLLIFNNEIGRNGGFLPNKIISPESRLFSQISTYNIEEFFEFSDR